MDVGTTIETIDYVFPRDKLKLELNGIPDLIRPKQDTTRTRCLRFLFSNYIFTLEDV
jgi:hypothetical protein